MVANNNSTYLEPVIDYDDINPRPEPLISAETRMIFEIIDFGILCTIVCLFGISSNMINIAVFYRQGLDSTTNITFFALAISDLCSLVILLWPNICTAGQPLFLKFDVPIDGPQVQYLTGSIPYACFSHITCWITAYITAERCLCIAIPLKVKQLITPRRTSVLLFVIYFINIISFVPEYCSMYLDWVFIPERNRSILALAFTEYKDDLEGLTVVFFAILGGVSFPAIVIFTVILVIKLKQQTTWRRKMAKYDKHDLTSNRDIKTVQLVVIIAVVLIISFTPGIVASVAIYYEPRINVFGEYVNTYFVVTSFAFLFGATNSSINIFFYYRMSTKYKNKFHEIFRGCKKQELNNETPMDPLSGP